MAETTQTNASDPPAYTEVVKENGSKKQADYPPSYDDCCTRGVKKYIGFSLFRFILHRLGRLQTAEDPELDIEHHLPSSQQHYRRASMVRIDNKRIRCYRCCILILIFLWLFLMYGVAIAMVLTGVFQTSFCPFDNHLIVVYLIVSGVTVILFLLMRFCICGTQVCVSCYKNRLPGTYFAYTMCTFEIVTFFILLFITCWLGVGIYFIFVRSPSINSTQLDPTANDYCAESVYIPAYIYLILQLLLIPWTVVTGLIICCGAKRCCCLYDSDYMDGAPKRTPAADDTTPATATAEGGTLSTETTSSQKKKKK